MSDRTNTKILNSKLKKMTVPKKKRRKRPALAAAPRRRRVTHHHAKPKTRRRRLSAGPAGTTLKGMLYTGIKGGAGGAIHEIPRFFTKMDTWPQIGFDVVGTVILAKYAKSPTMAAGFAGAAVSRHMDTMFHKHMNDNLEDHEWVDSDLLEDSGFDDEFGDAIVSDDDGNMYALADDGESYEHIGHLDDMDDEGMGDELENISMIPLQNAYALQHGYGY